MEETKREEKVSSNFWLLSAATIRPHRPESLQVSSIAPSPIDRNLFLSQIFAMGLLTQPTEKTTDNSGTSSTLVHWQLNIYFTDKVAFWHWVYLKFAIIHSEFSLVLLFPLRLVHSVVGERRWVICFALNIPTSSTCMHTTIASYSKNRAGVLRRWVWSYQQQWRQLAHMRKITCHHCPLRTHINRHRCHISNLLHDSLSLLPLTNNESRCQHFTSDLDLPQPHYHCRLSNFLSL